MKKTIRNVICGFLCLVTSLSAFGCKSDKKAKENYDHNGRYQKVLDGDSYLVENGASSYAILLREGYDEAEEFAAEEFNKLLKEASGVQLPVVTQADLSSTTKYISIGDTAMSEAAKVDPTKAEYTRNGFHIKNYKDGLVINAPERSGLIYGVYRFFEKNCNYMYYDVDTSVIDRSESVVLKEFDFQDWPDFLNREVYSYGTKENPAYAMSLYTTGGQFSKWESKYGEGTWWSKTLDDQSFQTALLQPGTYKEMYPHWFYVEPGATGQAAYPQMCYTEGLYSKDTAQTADGSKITSINQVTTNDGSAGMFWTLVYNLINNHILVEKDKTVFSIKR